MSLTTADLQEENELLRRAVRDRDTTIARLTARLAAMERQLILMSRAVMDTPAPPMFPPPAPVLT